MVLESLTLLLQSPQFWNSSTKDLFTQCWATQGFFHVRQMLCQYNLCPAQIPRARVLVFRSSRLCSLGFCLGCIKVSQWIPYGTHYAWAERTQFTKEAHQHQTWCWWILINEATYRLLYFWFLLPGWQWALGILCHSGSHSVGCYHFGVKWLFHGVT